MHLISRQRRNNLRNRVANGEVDLEALGIKRLTVPENVLKKMPIYTYVARAPGAASPSPTEETFIDDKTQTRHKMQRASTATTSTVDGKSGRRSWLQPTCAICLEDFVPGESSVRELPCLHIFHPECIDPFFRENSSLCPMCKKSVLPRGYCPAHVTNAMVRRERTVRRLRDRVPGEHHDSEDSPLSRWNRAIISRVPGVGRRRRDSQLPTTIVPAPARRMSTRAPSVELSDRGSTDRPRVPRPESIDPARGDSIAPVAAAVTRSEGLPKGASDHSATADASIPTIEVPPRPPEGRTRGSLWARRRAAAMVGNDDIDVQAEEDRRPAWRRAADRVFPRAS